MSGNASRSMRRRRSMPVPPKTLRDYALHLVFWSPPGTALASDVVPGMIQFEADVRASLSSGQQSIFSVPGLYPHVDPKIASIDEVNDSDAIPSDRSQRFCAGSSQPCATAAQVGREVVKVASRRGWAGGSRALVLMVLAQPVLACDESGCTQEAEPCGFHGYADGRSKSYVYALVTMSGVDARCGGNGMLIPPDLDAAVLLTGHEQNEAVADPDGEGIEVADPCAGHFGQNIINGHQYTLPYLRLPSGRCSIVQTQSNPAPSGAPDG